jgi:hypothetical protein
MVKKVKWARGVVKWLKMLNELNELPEPRSGRRATPTPPLGRVPGEGWQAGRLPHYGPKEPGGIRPNPTGSDWFRLVPARENIFERLTIAGRGGKKMLNAKC